MQALIRTIKQIKAGNSFSKYIDYIRFPFFRSLEKDSKIDFDFPFTVFVGRNGSGKSSVLQALYGAPGDYSVSRYWFTTHVDPIRNNAEGDRPCFIYSYKISGNSAEVLKTRQIKAKNGKVDPDYWETSRPRDKYGMKKLKGNKRNKPIQMNSIYMNFRTMISAFDKHFYFSRSFPQSYLRLKSKALSRAIIKSIIIKVRNVSQNRKPKVLTLNELKIMSDILGKNYTKGTVIEHKFFGEWGKSILFEVNDIQYSEAFAGSGEMAVANIVHEVLSADANSLILLDEPEISLHPGAQRKLKEFLLDQIIQHKHQMVISTHSPVFVEDLPKSAIKMFAQLPDGKIRITQDILPEEAFHELGHQSGSKKCIIVEDILGQMVVKAVLKEMGAHTESMVETYLCPGGASSVIQHAATMVSTNRTGNKFLLLDGDQEVAHKNPDDITIAQQTVPVLQSIIKAQCGNFCPSFGLETNHPDLVATMIKFVKFYYNKVSYLPSDTPEEMIWNDTAAKGFLETVLGKTPAQANTIMQAISAETSYKGRFRALAEQLDLDGSGIQIQAVHTMLIKRFVTEKGPAYQSIKTYIDTVKQTT